MTIWGTFLGHGNHIFGTAIGYIFGLVKPHFWTHFGANYDPPNMGAHVPSARQGPSIWIHMTEKNIKKRACNKNDTPPYRSSSWSKSCAIFFEKSGPTFFTLKKIPPQIPPGTGQRMAAVAEVGFRRCEVR